MHPHTPRRRTAPAPRNGPPRRSPSALRRIALRAAFALLTLLGSAALLLAAAAPAAAHAAVVSTTPADRAVLDRAPATVGVRFSESVLATADSLRVLAGDGSRVDTGNAALVPGDSAEVAVALRPGLGDGTYTAAWRVTSADSHPVHGAFTFSIGAPGPVTGPLPGADRGFDPLLGTLMTIARGTGYAGLALLVGGTGILLLVPNAADRARPLRLATLGGFLVIATAGMTLLVQGPYADGYGPGRILDADLLHSTLRERIGMALAARIVLTAIAMTMPAMGLVRVAPTWRARARGLPALLPAVAAVATFSAAGHAVTGYQMPAAFTADVLHLVAMGLWLGGLAALCALYLHGSRPDLLAVTAARFSPLAACCVGVLVVTGTYQGWRQTGTLDDLVSTEYGRLLVLKVTAVLVTLAMAYQARRWTRRNAGRRAGTGAVPGAAPAELPVQVAAAPVPVGAVAVGVAAEGAAGAAADGGSGAAPDARPAVRADAESGPGSGSDAASDVPADAEPDAGADPDSKPDADSDPAPDARPVRQPEPPAPESSVMRRTVLLESAGGIAVLVLTTLLAGSPPPREQAHAPAVQAAVRLSTAYDTQGPNGRGTVTARITPQPGGDAAVDVRLTGPSGKPAAAVEVTCAWSLPSLDIGPLSTTLEPDGAGRWLGSSHLAPAGTWSLAVTVRTSDIDETTVRFPKVAAGSPR